MDTTNLKNINKFSWKRVLILVLFILFSTITVCALIFWKMNEVIKIQDDHIKIFINQIDNTADNIHKLSLE